MTNNLTVGVTLAASFAVSSALVILLHRQFRRYSRKARMKWRLLTKDADGIPVWRTVHGKCLVGWPNGKGEITSGEWGDEVSRDWVVIEASEGKLVVYRFDQYVRNAPKTGVIQVYDSWREFESAVPAAILENALLGAGIKKPAAYREEPLEL